MSDWRALSDEDLWKQYDPRQSVPEWETTVTELTSFSATVRQQVAADLNVEWDFGDRRKVDLFRPVGPARDTTVLFLHGGWWSNQGWSKDSVSFLAVPFIAAGFGFAALGYEFCPDISMDFMLRQTQDAVIWLRANLAEHGMPADRLLIAGHGGGGHLATMLTQTNWAKFGQPPASEWFIAACAISSLFDLEPLRKTPLNDTLRMDPSCAHRNSPLSWTARKLEGAPPLLLAVAEHDSAEFKRQQSEFAGAWSAAGASVTAGELEGRDHFSAIADLADPEHPIHQYFVSLAG